MAQDQATGTSVPADIAALSFEEALAELQELVKRLERGDNRLEEAIKSYERGAALLVGAGAVQAQNLQVQLYGQVNRALMWADDETQSKWFHVDGQPSSGSLFDFGVYFYRNARRLVDKGSGPYFYLPKTESHLSSGWKHRKRERRCG